MENDIIYDFGVDFNSNWEFSDNDIKLVKYNDNIIQVCKNLLRTELDELLLFYEEYGSLLSHFFGWKRNDETLSVIKTEVDTALSIDPRLQDFDTEIIFNEIGGLDININIYINGINTNVNLVLDENWNILEGEEEE